MIYSSADKLIFKELFSTNTFIDIYSFHENHNLSPAHISSFIHRFKKNMVIEQIENEIRLTDYGRKWVVEHKKDIFLKIDNQSWKFIPKEWIS